MSRSSCEADTSRTPPTRHLVADVGAGRARESVLVPTGVDVGRIVGQPPGELAVAVAIGAEMDRSGPSRHVAQDRPGRCQSGPYEAVDPKEPPAAAARLGLS